MSAAAIILIVIGVALVVFGLAKPPVPVPPPTVFTCPHCDATFSTEAELNAHIQAEHPTEPTIYTCPHCGATFSSEVALATHIAAEHPEEPPVGKVRITDISIDKRNLVEGDAFTISITFSNPNDYDVWVKPEFGFGLLTGEPLELVLEPPVGPPRPRLMLKGFEAEAVLEGIGWDGMITPGGPKMMWLNLGIVAIKGSNMTNYLYDPDGAALTSGSYAYLKVPAKGQATTSKLWHISGSARSKRIRLPSIPWIHIFETEVYPPIDLDVCVKVESAFNLIYHPEGIGIIRYGLPEAIEKTRHYEKVGYAPFSGAVPDVVNVKSEKTPK